MCREIFGRGIKEWKQFLIYPSLKLFFPSANNKFLAKLLPRLFNSVGEEGEIEIDRHTKK